MRVLQRPLIAEIQSRGFRFWDENATQKLFRNSMGRIISIRKTKTLDEQVARDALYQAGLIRSEVDAFIQLHQQEEP